MVQGDMSFECVRGDKYGSREWLTVLTNECIWMCKKETRKKG